MQVHEFVPNTYNSEKFLFHPKRQILSTTQRELKYNKVQVPRWSLTQETQRFNGEFTWFIQ
jgi:hypothetical protein